MSHPLNLFKLNPGKQLFQTSLERKPNAPSQDRDSPRSERAHKEARKESDCEFGPSESLFVQTANLKLNVEAWPDAGGCVLLRVPEGK